MNITLAILALAFVSGSQPEPGKPSVKAKTPAGVPRVLVMKDLSRRSVKFLAIGPEMVQVVGPRGKTTGVPRRDVLALLPDGPGEGVASGSAGETKLLTARGEMLLGSLGSAEEGKEKAETIVWKSRRLGDVAFGLDDLAVIDLVQDSHFATPTAPTEDVVRLINGDALRGFVDSIGETVRVEVDKKPRSVPIERVARVEFGNPPKPLAGAVVWLATGEILRVTRLTGTPADSTAVRDGKDVHFPTEEIVGFVESAGTLLPLAVIAPSSVAPFGTRSVADPMEVGDLAVPLGAADVTLPSPMVVSWVLPEGAVRVSMRAVLPPACRVWGDCVLILEQEGVKGIGGKTLAKVRLSGDTPEADINVELLAGGGALRATLDPGENGPIQDRVVLRQPLVLVGAGAGAVR